ncbi:MAG: alpha/beta hydrolase [Cereibacter sphaeroides]|uniref:Alpha/beta hydrolase n=1 Tax=Cereibacter sphaeroides TaxID=1063 RepID=A0A2W5SF63_CERSP|nr:MAG: alpha/beta hydrolase [Cereibacter sphaeroides]
MGLVRLGMTLAAMLFAAGVALADTAIPSQDGWVGARQTVTTANGQQLSYVAFGAEDGLPLILLHGYTDNSRSWSLLAPYFKDRRVIAVDLRGHGGSAAPACCYGLDSLADDLGGFMDAMNIEKADIVGHSLGSMTAGTFAALHPERVNKLVLISTAFKAPQGASDWLWANVPSLPDKIDPDSQFMKDWYYNPNPVPADYIDRERAESAATPKQVWMGVLTGLTLADWSGLVPRITAPTLILWGDQDGLFDAASQEAVKAAFPKAEYQAYPGFGHNMFWETPETVGARITGFLSE